MAKKLKAASTPSGKPKRSTNKVLAESAKAFVAGGKKSRTKKATNKFRQESKITPGRLVLREQTPEIIASKAKKAKANKIRLGKIAAKSRDIESRTTSVRIDGVLRRVTSTVGKRKKPSKFSKFTKKGIGFINKAVRGFTGGALGKHKGSSVSEETFSSKGKTGRKLGSGQTSPPSLAEGSFKTTKKKPTGPTTAPSTRFAPRKKKKKPLGF